MRVQLPNGTIIEGVPEGTTKDQIMQKAISAGLATAEDFGVQASTETPAKGSLTPEQFADMYGDQPDIEGLIAPSQPKPEASIGEKAVGVGEAALTTATGATGGMVGMIGGTLKGLADEIRSGKFGTQEAADRIGNLAAEYSQALTYAPRTETGQEYVQAIGEAGEALAPLAGVGGQLTAVGQMAKVTPQAVKAADLASKATAPVRPKGKPVEVIQAEQSGIPITEGEALKSTQSGFDKLKQEQFLLEQSGEAGDTMRAFKLNQSREIKKYLEDISPEQAGEVGAAVKDAIQLRENSARFKRAQAYDTLAEVTKDIDVELSKRPILDAFPEPGEFRDFAATKTGEYNALRGLMEEFGIINGDGKIPVENLSISNQERFRKRLASIEDGDPTGATSRIVGPIRQALDSEFELASNALEKTGAPDVALAAKNARLSHVALKTEFDDKALVSQLIADKSFKSRVPSIEESQVYSKLVAKSTPIEQFDKVIKSLDRAGGRGRFAKNSMKAEFILDLMDSGYGASSRKIQGERTFGANAFVKRYDQLEPKLKKVFTPEEFAKLKLMRKQAEDLIPPAGAIPKGSAGFFIDSMAKLGVFSLLNKIPTVGPIIGNQVQEMGRSAKAASMANRAVQGYKPDADLLMLIEKQYPRLGAGIGLGVAVETMSDEEQ